MDPVIKITKLPEPKPAKLPAEPKPTKAEPKPTKAELKSMPIDYEPLEKQVTETGQLIYQDDAELKNHMFGEIVEAVQLYNSLVSLYVHNSFVLVAKKKSKRATNKQETVPEHLKIDENLLEYDSFLKMIRTDCTSQDKSAFCELVKNLLKILFQHENLYEVVFFKLNQEVVKAKILEPVSFEILSRFSQLPPKIKVFFSKF